MDEVYDRLVADYAGEDAWLPVRLRPILAQKLAEADLDSLLLWEAGGEGSCGMQNAKCKIANCKLSASNPQSLIPNPVRTLTLASLRGRETTSLTDSLVLSFR